MTSIPKSSKYVQENDLQTIPTTQSIQQPQHQHQSPLCVGLGGGHKASFKSTKLARRARSFKEDFLGKITQMRSPGTTSAMRSHSPKQQQHNIKNDTIDLHQQQYNKSPIQELDELCRQIQFALKHFRDVVSKQKLEMLSGNGTVVLDTVWHINLAVKSSVEAESSSSITSAINHMYQSVARLIKLCDDVLIDNKSAELDEKNVSEIVQQVEDAVKNLIQLAQEKISAQQLNYKTTPRTSSIVEMPQQRNSLPDIPLTPREREILAQTSGGNSVGIRNSHSSESVLGDPNQPPPKPPLPDSLSIYATPPPLPPKKKNKTIPINYCPHQLLNDDNFMKSASLERVSIRSKSSPEPDDNLSLLSESGGSIDSMLNNSSREEDEIKALMMDDVNSDQHDYYHPHTQHDIYGTNSWEESSLCSSLSNNEYKLNQHTTSINDYHRLSNTDSGIMSVRSSNYSKRSSQQSTTSQQQQQQQQKQHHNEMIKSESIVQNLNKTIETCLTLKSSTTSTTTTSSSYTLITNNDDDLPPAIPQKTKRKSEQRQPSPYDNVPDDALGGELLVTCQMHQSHQSLSSNTSVSSNSVQESNKPPPLPPKKKHIMAYMEMFGNCSHVNDQEFMRHSVHVQSSSHWVQTTANSNTLPTTQSCSFTSQLQQQQQTSSSSSSSSCSGRLTQSQNSPKIQPLLDNECCTTPPALPPKQRQRKTPIVNKTQSNTHQQQQQPQQLQQQSQVVKVVESPTKSLPDLLEHTNDVEKTKSLDNNNVEVNPCDIDLMEKLNVDEYLVIKKPDEDGPDIRGGPIDALIIQATKATKNGVFAYQEAFLTTYRTFITPHNLINKLIRRYNYFYFQPDKKPRSREAFALIVRVVSDLTASDLDENLQHTLMNFVQQLISCGELTLAKALRVKHLERHEAKQATIKYNNPNVVSSISLNGRDLSLLNFKSEHIAEQMTLLDAELFMKIEIPEVLIWAQEQNEERSPNLTRFTEHFNKMSYWSRTRLLTAETKDIREKYFLKFIKVMKHLRKINNYNSYLALLSALDSAPIRRLEWQKHVQEGLKEYCALIDSSSSFRAYRQALAETQPPCIPYIGLVLQDLTFVHIGNTNLLPDGTINFTKRWQQFNIVENMKKFKKSTYTFKKNEKIIEFFQNFDDCIGEDAMWQLSEQIKPRGGKKTTNLN